MPDLGEDNTMQTTFHQFARAFIPEYEGVEPYSTFVERYYKGKKQDNELITFKLSDKMKTLIENFVTVYAKAAEFTEDFNYKQKYIGRKELNDLLHDRYEDRPLFERFDFVRKNMMERDLLNQSDQVSSKYDEVIKKFIEVAKNYKFY